MMGFGKHPADIGHGARYKRRQDGLHYSVVFVLGAGHSGSTLLNLLLNGHSRAVGLCEVHTIHRYLRLPKDDPRNPLTHPFWRRVAACWERRTGVSFSEIDVLSPRWRQLRSWSEKERARYVEQNRALFDCAAAVSEARVLADSSHNRRRLWLLHRSGTIDLKIVHLIRDGRALVNSYARKYGSFGVGFRRWFVPTLMGLCLRRRLPDAQWITVRYEDLAGNPEPTLRRICAFVGIEFEPAMLRYWEHEDVSIGGNRLRRRKRPIRLDERWRWELSPVRRAAFTLAGGWLNALCGYPFFASYRAPDGQPSPDGVAEGG